MVHSGLSGRIRLPQSLEFIFLDTSSATAGSSGHSCGDRILEEMCRSVEIRVGYGQAPNGEERRHRFGQSRHVRGMIYDTSLRKYRNTRESGERTVKIHFGIEVGTYGFEPYL